MQSRFIVSQKNYFSQWKNAINLKHGQHHAMQTGQEQI